MKKISFLSVVVMLGGCSTLSSQYNCNAIVRSGCSPVAKVYEATHSKHEYRDQSKKSGPLSQGSTRALPRQTTQTIATITPGDPLLTKPTVMRVLYNSFESTEGDLDSGGYVYLKMKESSWLVDQ